MSRTLAKLLQSIGQIIAFDRGCLSLMNSFSGTSENNTTSHILLRQFLCSTFCCRQHGSIFNYFYEFGTI